VKRSLTSTGVTTVYSKAGFSSPRLLALNRRPNGDVALWLEDVHSGGDSVPGTQWNTEDYRRFAYGLGVAQGRIAAGSDLDDRPWLTRHFLRDYVLSKRVDRGILYSDEAWRGPLPRDNFPIGALGTGSLVQGARMVLPLMERLPRTLCHLDVWPNNLFARKDGTFTLVDWSFVGEALWGGRREPGAGLSLRPVRARRTTARP
jgi:hypothetical protein